MRYELREIYQKCTDSKLFGVQENDFTLKYLMLKETEVRAKARLIEIDGNRELGRKRVKVNQRKS